MAFQTDQITDQNSTIENVDFYGEDQRWPTPDLIHCEALETRSEKHGWTIKPHRHKGLLQLFHLYNGSAQAHLDSRDIELCSADLLVVPEMVVHDFIWSPDSTGHVLFIAKPLITQLDHKFGTLDWGGRTPAQIPLGDDRELINQLFAAILGEYQQLHKQRSLMIESLVSSLCVWLSRNTPILGVSEQQQDRAAIHFSRFSRLVEEHYNKQANVSWYATQTGITPSHLNTVCQKIAGRSALEIIHQRLLLEAKRNLVYTAKPIAEIADQLGFSEASYFNRFFKRNTAQTPKQFRRDGVEKHPDG